MPQAQLYQRQDSVVAASSYSSSVPSLDNYQIGKEIGKGAYASVKLIHHKTNGNKYALKVYEKFKLNDSMKKKAV